MSEVFVPGRGRATRSVAREAGRFWSVATPRASANPQAWRHALRAVVDRVMASGGTVLYDAVESGVPTSMVELIAGATGEPAGRVMELIGVSPSTFRRKDEAGEPLPEAAGHRVMHFLRLLATLRRLLEESGNPEAMADFDLEGWVAHWIRQPQAELGGKTPADMMRNPEGQRAVEQLLERMRGGLPA